MEAWLRNIVLKLLTERSNIIKKVNSNYQILYFIPALYPKVTQIAFLSVIGLFKKTFLNSFTSRYVLHLQTLKYFLQHQSSSEDLKWPSIHDLQIIKIWKLSVIIILMSCNYCQNIKCSHSTHYDIANVRARFIPTYAHDQIFTEKNNTVPVRCTPTFHSSALDVRGYQPSANQHLKRTQPLV